MFTQFRNIDTAFSHIKTFSLWLIAACVLLSGFALWKSFEMVRQMSAKVYILANGKALEALSAERKDNLAVEIRDHVKMFHYWFFTLDPDEKVISSNIGKALYLADGSAKRAYDNLREQGYFAGLVSANISQTITIDSVLLDMQQEPFRFTCYASQRLVRSSSTVSRKLITRGELRNVSRSDNNPHGFLIQRWETVLNQDIPKP